jgi:hypothetical protein
MLIEITVPVGVLGLVDSQPLPEGTELEFERTASVLDGGFPSLVVSGDDTAAVVCTIRNNPTIEDTTITDDTDETVLRLNWDAAVPHLLESIRENDGTVLSAIARNDVWTFDIRFPSKDALLNARRRRGGVVDLQFHGARDGFSTSEDAVAVTHGGC